MPNHSAFSVAVQGEQMRAAQQLYFQLATVSRKTKTPADYAAASNALKVSKQLERVFDDTVREVFKEGGKPATADLQTNGSFILDLNSHEGTSDTI